MRFIQGGVTAAKGFSASSATAGIKPSRKPDLALVKADGSVTAVAIFTDNRVQAAPVVLSRRKLIRPYTQAVFINSGCANCLTGEPGLRDAKRLNRDVAKALGIPERDVLLMSTGLIGTRIPVRKVQRVIPQLVRRLGRDQHTAAARGMLTTDRVSKEAAVEAIIDGVRVRLGGMAKGAGMIAPSMATMLCVITTDAKIAPGPFQAALRRATQASFNCISIDGDKSTNDTVFALASGRSGVTIRSKSALKQWEAMLQAVTLKLAERIVEDGEGVTRIADIYVMGAKTEADAQRCAQQVGGSSLVKTMLAGGDPNVGRIAGAVGASGIVFDPKRLEIRIGKTVLVRQGAAVILNSKKARSLLKRKRVSVVIDLHAGSKRGWMLTSDLTEAYVRINAHYTT